MSSFGPAPLIVNVCRCGLTFLPYRLSLAKPCIYTRYVAEPPAHYLDSKGMLICLVIWRFSRTERDAAGRKRAQRTRPEESRTKNTEESRRTKKEESRTKNMEKIHRTKKEREGGGNDSSVLFGVDAAAQAYPRRTTGAANVAGRG
jgi:hypothetical protein